MSLTLRSIQFFRDHCPSLVDSYLVLCVGHRALEPFCENDVQRRVLDLPGYDVAVVYSAMPLPQTLAQIPFYVNALLIASRGEIVSCPCDRCYNQPYPFSECFQLPGFCNGCCANCQWPDQTAYCSLQHLSIWRMAPRTAHPRPAQLPAIVIDIDSDTEMVGDHPIGRGSPQQAGLLPAPGDSAENPIILDEHLSGEEATSDSSEGCLDDQA
jgi:hypothetical protein